MNADGVVYVWGINPTIFLIGYWAAWVAVLAPGLVHLARTRLWTHVVDVDKLGPAAVAYIAGGPWRVVQTSLGWLRSGRAIRAYQGEVYTRANAPPGSSAIDRTIWRAAGRGAPIRTLLRDSRVAREIGGLVGDLERLGLVTRRSTRRMIMIGITVLSMVGTARYFAGLANGHLDERLIISTMALASAGVGIAYAITRPATATGRYALGQLRHREWKVTQQQHPYGVAMAIALSGPEAMRELDAVFATHAGFVRPKHPWAGIDLTGGSGSTAGYHGGNFGGLGGDGGGGGGGG